MKNLILKLLVVLTLFPATGLALDYGVQYAYGFGDYLSDSHRFGIQVAWPKTWCEDCVIKTDGYFELSTHFLTVEEDFLGFINHDSLTAVAVAPVFRLHPAFFNYATYIEAGIGVAWLDDTEFGTRDLGMHGQFEDRIGVGVLLGNKQQYDINFRFFHFSNAVLSSDNDGLNVFYIGLGYWFK